MAVEHIVTIVTALIAVIGGAGFWSWMQQKSKQNFERQKIADADKVQFRENLMAQVDELKLEVKKLQEQVLQLTKSLAESEAARQHAEDMLRLKNLK